MMKTAAIVLAAGSGSRMGSQIKKQYMELGGKPVVYYALKAFEDSFIDEIVLVCSKEDTEYCRSHIVAEYGFKKVKCVVEGGPERYISVGNGLKALTDCDYVYIHDGARPFLDQEVLNKLKAEVEEHQAVVTAVPSKDTVKIIDKDGFVISTPSRKTVWCVQTPQVFSYRLIRDAYERMEGRAQNVEILGLSVTDDAMIIEYFTDKRVKLVMGSYSNMKITTPEDMLIAESLLKKRAEEQN